MASFFCKAVRDEKKVSKVNKEFGEEVMFDNSSLSFSSIRILVARTFQSDLPSIKTTTCCLTGKMLIFGMNTIQQ